MSIFDIVLFIVERTFEGSHGFRPDNNATMVGIIVGSCLMGILLRDFLFFIARVCVGAPVTRVIRGCLWLYSYLWYSWKLTDVKNPVRNIRNAWKSYDENGPYLKFTDGDNVYKIRTPNPVDLSDFRQDIEKVRPQPKEQKEMAMPGSAMQPVLINSLKTSVTTQKGVVSFRAPNGSIRSMGSCVVYEGEPHLKTSYHTFELAKVEANWSVEHNGKALPFECDKVVVRRASPVEAFDIVILKMPSGYWQNLKCKALKMHLYTEKLPIVVFGYSMMGNFSSSMGLITPDTKGFLFTGKHDASTERAWSGTPIIYKGADIGTHTRGSLDYNRATLNYFVSDRREVPENYLTKQKAAWKLMEKTGWDYKKCLRYIDIEYDDKGEFRGAHGYYSRESEYDRVAFERQQVDDWEEMDPFNLPTWADEMDAFDNKFYRENGTIPSPELPNLKVKVEGSPSPSKPSENSGLTKSAKRRLKMKEKLNRSIPLMESSESGELLARLNTLSEKKKRVSFEKLVSSRKGESCQAGEILLSERQRNALPFPLTPDVSTPNLQEPTTSESSGTTSMGVRSRLSRRQLKAFQRITRRRYWTRFIMNHTPEENAILIDCALRWCLTSVITSRATPTLESLLAC
jgi:hypothetical protein